MLGVCSPPSVSLRDGLHLRPVLSTLAARLSPRLHPLHLPAAAAAAAAVAADGLKQTDLR